MKKLLKRLITQARNWVSSVLAKARELAIVAARTQLYVAVLFVLIIISAQLYEPNLLGSVICGLLVFLLVCWWAWVTFGFVKEKPKAKE